MQFSKGAHTGIEMHETLLSIEILPFGSFLVEVSKLFADFLSKKDY